MKWFTSQGRRSSSASRGHGGTESGTDPEPLLIKISPLKNGHDTTNDILDSPSIGKFEIKLDQSETREERTLRPFRGSTSNLSGN